MRGVKYATEEERLEALREAQRRYGVTEKGKAKYAKYRQGLGYEAAQVRFKAKGRRSELAAIHHAQTKLERPALPKAWNAVRHALASGKLVRPDLCSRCQNPGNLVAHHHLGYAKEHQLDVQWLCRPCHKAVHPKEEAA